ncbi:hypothetical protein DYB25_011462 [Aphanomyces astaci]|uniref:Uncharacterized protein n=1 Tax=Aphanomyces astaci TaxID=112090 RepID=A0A397BXD5_APHAT|nr:hypothetical protein DYB25_011462 [Aphanomyces astaci]
MDRSSNSLQPRSAGERQNDDAIEREDRPQLLPVTSRIYCTFSDCLQCTHGFNDSYLRCFPHCCPTHMPNSTCGTSIVMQVAGQFSHDEAMSFVAYARFETTSDPPSFPLGYRLPAANFADSDSKASVWYPGGRSTNEPSTVLMRYTFNEHMQRPWSYGWTSSASAALRNTLHVFKVPPTGTLLYTFNELSTQLGWPYHWKGSATKADRNQQHVFKVIQTDLLTSYVILYFTQAYVFQLLPDNQTLRVVNWISHKRPTPYRVMG